VGLGSRKRARARGGGACTSGGEWVHVREKETYGWRVVWVHAIVFMGQWDKGARRWARFYEGPGVERGRGGGGAYDEVLLYLPASLPRHPVARLSRARSAVPNPYPPSTPG
jgi:hypothetical protein